MIELVPYFEEICLINLTGGGLKINIQNILKAISDNSKIIRKIKVSNMNLNDNHISNTICKLIEEQKFLTNLDISWGRFSAQHLFSISKSLCINPNQIVNLNISYNSVTFKEHQVDQFFNSEDFLDQFCEYLEATESLNHIDLSGLSFGREQLALICPLLTQINTLMAVHLSDMGIKRNEEDPDQDLMLEVLDYFGINNSFIKIGKETTG